MFKEEETQYCPMCEEWAEKYNKLKAENERYKPILDRLLQQFETYDKLKSLDVVTFAKQTFEQLNQLKADNDKLKQYKASKQASYETMQREWNKAKNEVKQLKAENKELKTEVDKFEEQIKLQGNFIDSFLFATKNSEWRNKSILEDEADAIIEKVEADYVQLEEYKQALEEIKELCVQDIHTFADGTVLRYSVCDKILQKCEVIKDEYV